MDDADLKACSTCGLAKPLGQFDKRAGAPDGHRNQCKPCRRAKQNAWCQANPDRVAKYKELAKQSNREKYWADHEATLKKTREHACKYRAANRERLRQKAREWFQKNRERVNRERRIKSGSRRDTINARHRMTNRRYYQKLKKNPDRLSKKREVFNRWRRQWMQIPSNRIAHNLRVRFRRAMQDHGNGKWFRARSYGIDFRELLKQLGPCPGRLGEWHIDHVVPCAAFDHTDPIQLRACWHHSNLRWMPGRANQSKGSKYNPSDRQRLLELAA